MDKPFFRPRWLLIVCITVCASKLAVVLGTGVTPILQPGFFFDYNDPTQPVPILVTEQCETIHLTWGRRSTTGPNPTAPYYLQVFTSNSTVPFVIPAGDQLAFDWAVPFAPGTMYQICMYDKFGTTGGCQDKYTVIPSSNSTLPTGCTNMTAPRQLTVDAIDDSGPLSRFGFSDQCKDISLTPKDGVPPYILTVAPALHPPYNITSFDMKPINWTLSLNWAMPFFIGLSDSNGSMWSNGPLHAGSGGTIGCLAGNVTSKYNSHSQIAVPAAIGLTFVGLALGILSGIGGSLGLAAYKRSKSDKFVELKDTGQNRIMVETRGSRRRPRPFPLPGQDLEESDPPAPNQLYVLHHDGNMPPVTIVHQEGAGVVELPPRYPSYSQSESEAFSEGREPTNPNSLGFTDRSNQGDTIQLTEQERRETNHYNPSGPWIRQPRQPAAVRKSHQSTHDE